MKRFFAHYAKSSAMFISLVIHGILIVIAITFVAVSVQISKDPEFVPPPSVERPKMPKVKLTPPKTKQKKPLPKLRKTLVVDRKMAPIQMPEIIGVADGLGNMMGSEGLESLGFGSLLKEGLFGSDEATSGNELKGIFFDLKQTQDGKPTQLGQTATDPDKKIRETAERQYANIVKTFSSGWKIATFRDYFKAPKEKYASFFSIPNISASAAPSAFEVGDFVKPSYWVAHYSGQFAAEETGRYRFCGTADNVLLVRVNNKLILDASLYANKGWYSSWKSPDENDGKFPLISRRMAIGDWFQLTAGKPTKIEVLIGENPGGGFEAQLLIENRDGSYKQAPFSYKQGKGDNQTIITGTRPVLPIFKTQEIPKKLYEKIKIRPDQATYDGPSFGVVKD